MLGEVRDGPVVVAELDVEQREIVVRGEVLRIEGERLLEAPHGVAEELAFGAGVVALRLARSKSVWPSSLSTS